MLTFMKESISKKPISKKPSKTAVVLIAGVTISGTPCPRHIIVPFGAEAPSGHVAQAWAIPPPSWGLLSLKYSL